MRAQELVGDQGENTDAKIAIDQHRQPQNQHAGQRLKNQVQDLEGDMNRHPGKVGNEGNQHVQALGVIDRDRLEGAPVLAQITAF